MQAQERINLYIAGQPEWHRRTLVRLRQLIHAADPGIEETWRGNAPHFDQGGILVGLHGFKHFVSAWFHKGALLKDTHGLFEGVDKGEDKGVRAYRIEEGGTIDEKAFTDLVKQSVKLNTAGTKPSGAKPSRKALTVPPEFEAVLKKDEQAWGHWVNFSHTCKKEYVEWIAEARQEETRKRRIAKAFEMIHEGQGKEDKHRAG